MAKNKRTDWLGWRPRDKEGHEQDADKVLVSIPTAHPWRSAWSRRRRTHLDAPAQV